MDVDEIYIRSIKAGLVCYNADNLEAAIVGGFSSNFSSKDMMSHMSLSV